MILLFVLIRYLYDFNLFFVHLIVNCFCISYVKNNAYIPFICLTRETIYITIFLLFNIYCVL